jgi:membrane-bound serine protease (ClpP class)
VARVRELADERGRDAAFGEDAIRDARNVGAREALEIGAVEYVATDVRDLLRQSDGAHVRPKDLTLHLADASLTHVGMPWTLRVLKRITDANLLYLLFGAGIIGLMFELTHPGVLLPGIAGGICLLVALYGMSVLPASGTGIALLVLGAALLAAESVAPGGGVLGAGGAIALVLGAMLLFDDSSGYGVSPALAIGTSVGLVAFFAIVLRKAARARRLPSPTDASFLVGQLATVQRPIAPEQAGSVLVDGELWQARSEVRIAAGERVLVSRVEGLFVDVTQPEEASP